MPSLAPARDLHGGPAFDLYKVPRCVVNVDLWLLQLRIHSSGETVADSLSASLPSLSPMHVLPVDAPSVSGDTTAGVSPESTFCDTLQPPLLMDLSTPTSFAMRG